MHISGGRFRVVGVMEAKGPMLGIDIDDVVYIPVASALRLFNLPELHELHVAYANAADADRIEADVRRG